MSQQEIERLSPAQLAILEDGFTSEMWADMLWNDMGSLDNGVGSKLSSKSRGNVVDVVKSRLARFEAWRREAQQ